MTKTTKELFTNPQDSEKKGVLVGQPHYSFQIPVDGVEMRSGESTDKVRARRNKEEIDTTDWTDEDKAIDWFENFLKEVGNTYSETYVIRDDGTFDLIRDDGLATSFIGMSLATKPEYFYNLAYKIEAIHPDLKFAFDVDSLARRFKYTVTKVKLENK